MTKNTPLSFVINTKASVNNTTMKFYVEGILTRARLAGLTITGEDYPAVRRGIECLRLGGLLTIGTSGTHDVDFIERSDFARERGLKPVYDLIDDYKAIIAKLDAFIESKMLRTLNGTPIEFCAGFVRVGREIIPNDVFAAMVAKIKY
jgi:hypothetical protein